MMFIPLSGLVIPRSWCMSCRPCLTRDRRPNRYLVFPLDIIAQSVYMIRAVNMFHNLYNSLIDLQKVLPDLERMTRV